MCTEWFFKVLQACKKVLKGTHLERWSNKLGSPPLWEFSREEMKTLFLWTNLFLCLHQPYFLGKPTPHENKSKDCINMIRINTFFNSLQV